MRFFFSLFVLLAYFFPFPASAEKVSKYINIGTASITGVYYPTGGTICKFVNSRFNNPNLPLRIRCSVISTAGSMYNINALNNGNIDIGIAQADWQYHAFHGTSIFKDLNVKMSNLRSLFSLHREYFTVLARRDANIKTFDDLKGKRVNIGAPGTGIRQTMLALMQAKGWSTTDFLVASELKTSEQAQALCDNKLDVITDFIGHPNAGIQEATVSCDTVLIPLNKKDIEMMVASYPFYNDDKIPGGLYNGNPQSTDTLALRASVVTTSELSEEVAYNVVKSIFDNLDNFRGVTPYFQHLTREGMAKNDVIPVHEGAKKYYQERNIH